MANNNELIVKKCNKCGSVVEILHDGTISCCGEEMKECKPNTVDAAIEKHIPTYEKVEEEIYVKVNHVMEEDHFIEWIAMVKEEKMFKVYLHPGEVAECRFKYIPDSTIYAYCNKHGLWKAEVK